MRFRNWIMVLVAISAPLFIVTIIAGNSWWAWIPVEVNTALALAWLAWPLIQMWRGKAWLKP